MSARTSLSPRHVANNMHAACGSFGHVSCSPLGPWPQHGNVVLLSCKMLLVTLSRLLDITAQHALVPYLRSSWLTKALLGHACDVWLKRATCIIAAPMLTTPLQGCTAVITGRMLQPPLMHCPAYLGPMFAQQLVNRRISKTCMRDMALSCMLPACVSCTPLEL